MARTARGPESRAPLFDRLADESPFSTVEQIPLRTHDRAALAESVRAELSRLLNTRLESRPRTTPPTVIDYGVADWTGLSAERTADRNQLAASMTRAIAAFEPRLRNALVEVDAIDKRRWALRVRISGELHAERERWPVAFVADLIGGTETRIEHERLD